MGHKGQLSIGFYASLVIFLGFLSYVTFQLFQIVPTATSTLKTETTQIEAYQISELLVNDGGDPIDWHTKALSEIKRIGLLDSGQNKTNLLSSSKILQLKTICTGNFSNIKTLLDIQNEASITFVNPITSDKWNCKSTSSEKPSFNITRIVSSDGTSFGEITVQVWQK